MTFNGEFEPGLLLAVAGMTLSARGLLGAKLVREDLETASQRCATLAIPESTAISPSAMPSTRGAFPGLACWPRGGRSRRPVSISEPQSPVTR
jgi:hypothetical protein